jgi:hypothetical protein
MAADARDERIEVRQPVQWSSERPASVILRPVLLPRLAELLAPDRAAGLAAERKRYAEGLVILRASTNARPISGPRV